MQGLDLQGWSSLIDGPSLNREAGRGTLCCKKVTGSGLQRDRCGSTVLLWC